MLPQFRLPPAPPRPNAGDDDDQRKQDDAEEEDSVHFAFAQVDRSILRVLGTNGNEVLVGREPIQHVEEHVVRMQSNRRNCQLG